MWRWIMAAIAMAGFILAFTTRSPGWLGLGLLLGFAGIIGVVWSIAAARVAASERPDSAMAGPEDLEALRRLNRSGPASRSATSIQGNRDPEPTAAMPRREPPPD